MGRLKCVNSLGTVEQLALSRLVIIELGGSKLLDARDGTMTAFALGLVLVSAVAHAGWNFIAKHASAGPVFNWLFDLMAVAVCLPLVAVLVLVEPPHLTNLAWVFIIGSALLELAYFLLLGQGYRTGDLTLVYPLARGTGPLLATAAAFVLLEERPSPLAVCGALLVGVGVFVLAGSPASCARPRYVGPSSLHCSRGWSSRHTRSGTNKPSVRTAARFPRSCTSSCSPHAKPRC